MVKTRQSSNDQGGRKVTRSAVVRLVRVATAREFAVNETEEEEEEGHNFNVGDCVKILRDKKRERVNQIARVVAIKPKSVWVKIEPDNTLFLKRVITIEYSEWDGWDHETSEEEEEWPPGRCLECGGYGPMGNLCMSSECEDSKMIYDSSGSRRGSPPLNIANGMVGITRLPKKKKKFVAGNENSESSRGNPEEERSLRLTLQTKVHVV
eukprot:scaffold8672_cov50-Attheya_sp.AAC.3